MPPLPAAGTRGPKRGSRVRHPTLGQGVVLELEGEGDDAKFPIFFERAGKKKLIARYATLETNAGVRVLAGMLDIWIPLTQLVDAGQTAPAVGTFPAVAASPASRAQRRPAPQSAAWARNSSRSRA